MLFSILWTSSRQHDLEFADDSVITVYLTKASQFLVAGGYQKPRPFSVEAVLLYAQCKYYLSREDANTDAWMIMGIGARLAMKMGYHRDPRHLAKISPFEGEMRRRTFFMLEAFDILLSLQAGLPAIIQENECDTDSPRNLFDEDFDENCKVLPPSRPPTDSTPMLYFVYKSRFAKTHRRVTRHALTLKEPSYDDTMRLDTEVHENHADVPPSLRVRSLASSPSNQPHQFTRRLHIETMYLQSLCVLHRKYLSHDRSNPAFAYSRKTCTDAALQILKHQADVHFASQPGGRFFKDKWMLSSLTLHNFLLAVTIICLDLYESQKESFSTPPERLDGQVAKHDALRLACEIWISRRAYSRDAHRACNVLAVMLSKVPRPKAWEKPGNNAPADFSTVFQTSRRGPEDASSTIGSTEGSSGNMSAFEMPNQGFSTLPAPDFSATDPLNTIFDGSENIDWGFIDQYLNQSNDAGDFSLDWQLPAAT